MGGATSLFNETNWDKADGRLEHPDDTLDGRPPTSKYQIYFLTKRGVNQREYDITDIEMNLLYTTRAVPGTVACFDVLGPGIHDYLLRVTVDLARRYWVVYRYGIPSFPGQLADSAATEKLSADFAEKDISSTPLLFKKCCIIVSWSRYMAVAALYGPPTMEMILSRTPTEDDEEGYEKIPSEEDDELFDEASRIAERMKAKSLSSDDEDSPSSLDMEHSEHSTLVAHNVQGERQGIQPLQSIDEHNSHECDVPTIRGTQSMPADLGHCCEDPIEIPTQQCSMTSNCESEEHNFGRSYSTDRLRQWLKQKSMSLKERSQAYLEAMSTKKNDPLEGVLHLDRPLLLCQEIYTRIIGNHQTSLISKERVVELLRQDAAEYIRTHGDDEDFMSEYDNGPETIVSGKGGIFDVSSPSCGVEETKDEILAEKNDPEDQGQRGSVQDCKDEQQPLVGYWQWQNSLRTHKMKMHVAKGADLALHVVLSIIVNQVRYERNAVAMTV